MLSWPSGVHSNIMRRRQHWVETFLTLYRLYCQPGTENCGCCRRPIFGCTSTPATGHPVVPHEIVVVFASGIMPAHEQVFEIECACHSSFRHALAPKLKDAIHDFFIGSGAESRYRMGPTSVDNGPLCTNFCCNRSIETRI